MTITNEVNPTANLSITNENPESSTERINLNDEEEIALLKLQLDELRGELRQVRELTHLTVTAFPNPPHFPSLDSLVPEHFPLSTRPPPIPLSFSNLPPVTPAYVPIMHKQTPYVPDYTHTSQNPLSTQTTTAPTYPTEQHIPGAHVDTSREQYVTPIYAARAPTVTAPVTVRVPFEVDQYADMERDAKIREDESIISQLHSLRKEMRSMRVTRGSESLDYDDLCIHPNIGMPVGYKPPKFDIFDGTGDPHAHLRAYSDKLVGVGRSEKLRMKLFIRSLSGEALTWYTRQDPRKWSDWQDMAGDFMNHFGFNTEITPKRFSLGNVQKKEGIYFEKMMGSMGQKFADLVKMGDFLGEGIKSGKIQSMAALQAASKATQSGSVNGIKKKKKDISNIAPYY
ncbi:uncharacterized protein LOC132622155 [Lycium barbarum]|uniref:uncharacterized protein LOC132622155 n=1 Tax=Lycium barbarum TaxID=112863 RepID=UPI00293E7315|nr:uncharacterized protein LOC132622155 [Lycium barbarum]